MPLQDVYRRLLLASLRSSRRDLPVTSLRIEGRKEGLMISNGSPSRSLELEELDAKWRRVKDEAERQAAEAAKIAEKLAQIQRRLAEANAERVQ